MDTMTINIVLAVVAVVVFIGVEVVMRRKEREMAKRAPMLRGVVPVDLSAPSRSPTFDGVEPEGITDAEMRPSDRWDQTIW